MTTFHKTLVAGLAGATIVGTGLGAGLGAGMALAETTGPQIALQLWTTRDFGTPQEQLALVKDAGVTHVETYGKFFGPEDDQKELLEGAGLDAISTHTDLASLRENIAGVIEGQKALGNHTIILPYILPEDRPADAAGWEALGTELGGFARVMDEAGMTFGYHNHDFDLVRFDGRTAVEIMLDAAGPLLKTEVDVGWVAAAGLDPVDYLDKVSGRVIAIHAKDLADPGNPGPMAGGMDDFGFDFTAVGDGTIDWAEVLPAAQKAGAEWFIIEHDFPPDASEVISRGNDFLTTAFAQ